MPDIFLIVPQDADIAAALKLQPQAVLLLRTDDAGYPAWVRRAAPLAQATGAAVLVEGTPAEAKSLSADGLHVTSDIDDLEAAIAALKPGMIVGAGDLRSRDDAMAAGEAGADYVFFGPLSGAIEPWTRDLAHWWAETMQVPAVLSDPEARDASAESEGCEFIALGESAWR